jgi:cytochrome c oxidase subunit 1
VLVAGSLFALFGGTYYWLPKWTGHMYDERLGRLHFWLSAVFVNLLFFPQHFLGLAGMPRRIPDYALQYADWNMLSSLGGFAFGLAQLLLLYNVVSTIRGGPKARSRVWDGAEGLEWTLSSPPPYHSFAVPPEVR